MKSLNGLFAVALVALLATTPALADGDRSYAVEVVFGIGANGVERPGFAFRAARDNAELHVARWGGDRRNTVVGLGAVGRSDNGSTNASATAGVAFVLNRNNVLSASFAPYVRAAAGLDADSAGELSLELSYARYGLASAESFVGVGVRSVRDTAPESVATGGLSSSCNGLGPVEYSQCNISNGNSMR